MRKFTKLMSLALSMIIVFACFIPVFADETVEYTDGGVKYLLNQTYNTASVVGSEESISGDVVVVSSIAYNNREYYVNRIEQNSFASRTEITSITVNEGVAQIDGNAFKNCTSLREVRLPSSLTVCAVTAFNGCTNLTVYAYRGLSNLPVIAASTSVEFVYLDEPSDPKGFFEGIWQLILNFFKRILAFLQIETTLT